MEEKIVRLIVQKCKEVLSRYCGARLKGVSLYGSVAGGAADLASDYEVGTLSLYRNARRAGVIV